MKDRLFVQKKRQTKGGTGYRMIHALVPRGKKQRASAASPSNANEVDEVPNFGVMSALMVILALHVVAIGAIFIHTKLNGGENYVAATEPPVAGAEQDDPPVPNEKYEQHVFGAGESYETIARKKGLQLEDLKRVNDYKQAKPGNVINLPILKASADPAPELAVIPDSTEAVPPIRPTDRPPIQVNNEIYHPEPAPAMVEVMPAGNAVLLRPNVEPEDTGMAVLQPEPVVQEQMRSPIDEPVAPRAVVVEEAPPAPAVSGRSHTVVSGDTIWKISRKYGVDQNALMKLNGISDPGKVRLGAVLKIPN